MIRCIIIEDELPAREILRSFLAELPEWELLADFDNAIEAIGFLAKHKVDVIFLDIQLPKLSGIGFLRSLAHPPIVVMTTAYGEHAVEAFELTVFDYLLKPFPFERFLKTANRIQLQLQGKSAPASPVELPCLVVRADRRTIKLPVADILFVESQKEYVRIVCATREMHTRMSITKIEALLGAHDFLRVHRSFLVAVGKVEAYSATELAMGRHVIPVGRLYQREVRERFG